MVILFVIELHLLESSIDSLFNYKSCPKDAITLVDKSIVLYQAEMIGRRRKVRKIVQRMRALATNENSSRMRALKMGIQDFSHCACGR